MDDSVLDMTDLKLPLTVWVFIIILGIRGTFVKLLLSHFLPLHASQSPRCIHGYPGPLEYKYNPDTCL